MIEAPAIEKVSALPDEERVLTLAVSRAAGLWELTNATLGRIIGVLWSDRIQAAFGSEEARAGDQALRAGSIFRPGLSVVGCPHRQR